MENGRVGVCVAQPVEGHCSLRGRRETEGRGGGVGQSRCATCGLLGTKGGRAGTDAVVDRLIYARREGCRRHLRCTRNPYGLLSRASPSESVGVRQRRCHVGL